VEAEVVEEVKEREKTELERLDWEVEAEVEAEVRLVRATAATR